VPFEFSKGKCKELEFLIDTGSEMNLIRKDVVPRDCWKNLTKILILVVKFLIFLC
jgi:hypothetical protein